jgi:hypothetical protein
VSVETNDPNYKGGDGADLLKLEDVVFDDPFRYVRNETGQVLGVELDPTEDQVIQGVKKAMIEVGL